MGPLYRVASVVDEAMYDTDHETFGQWSNS